MVIGFEGIGPPLIGIVVQHPASLVCGHSRGPMEVLRAWHGRHGKQCNVDFPSLEFDMEV